MTILTCKDLTFAYDGKIAARDLNFSVESGDYLCIVGENGAGKSTLMKGLLNLKAPHSGSITWDKALKRTDIGYLPQQSAIQRDFPATSFEVVLSGCLNQLGRKPFYGKRERALAHQKLAQLGADHLAKRSYRTLSGGQQQRVLLARALCSAQKLLVLDEPAAGLDPLVTADLYQLVSEINKAQKLTIIMVSHDVQSAVQYADKILHLNTVQQFFGSTADYLDSAVGKRFVEGRLIHA